MDAKLITTALTVPLALVVLALVLPLGFGIKLKTRGAGVDIGLSATLLGIIRPRVTFRIELKNGEAMLIFHGLEKRLGGKKKKRTPEQKMKRRKSLLAALSAVRAKRIELRSEIGIASDAALTVFICGAGEVVLSTALDILRSIAPKPFSETEKAVAFSPRFGENTFFARASLSARAVPIAAVCGAVKARSKIKTYKEKNYASHRKHHRNVPRAYKESC